jgi:hypothetical protein
VLENGTAFYQHQHGTLLEIQSNVKECEFSGFKQMDEVR